MHYYKRNLGDYAKKAGRLSMLQHGSYTLLIDACYDRERFPTFEEAMDWTWASSKEEREAVEFVLGKFFVLIDGVYVQERIKQELEEYQAKAEKNAQIAKNREANRTNRARIVHEPPIKSHESPPNQEPLTTNHKPVLKPDAAKAARFDPLNFDFSEIPGLQEKWGEWIRYRRQRKISVLQATLEKQAERLRLVAQFGGSPCRMIEQSIENGWIGLFDVVKGNGATKETKQQAMDRRSSEAAQRAIERLRQQSEQESPNATP